MENSYYVVGKCGGGVDLPHVFDPLSDLWDEKTGVVVDGSCSILKRTEFIG